MSEFYGFSPQNHVGQAPTLTNPKYAVYDYLQNIDPRSPWAQAAADVLNKQFNTSQFNALDAETLGYGDEYVHSGRPGGPGATGSLSNPGTGDGAFTWGSTTPEGQTPPTDPKALAAIMQLFLHNGNGSSQPQNPFVPVNRAPTVSKMPWEDPYGGVRGGWGNGGTLATAPPSGSYGGFQQGLPKTTMDAPTQGPTASAGPVGQTGMDLETIINRALMGASF